MSLQAAYDAGFDLAMEKEAGIKDKIKSLALATGINAASLGGLAAGAAVPVAAGAKIGRTIAKQRQAVPRAPDVIRADANRGAFAGGSLGALVGGIGSAAADMGGKGLGALAATTVSSAARRRRLKYLESIKGNKKAKAAYTSSADDYLGKNTWQYKKGRKTKYMDNYEDNKYKDIEKFKNDRYKKIQEMKNKVEPDAMDYYKKKYRGGK